MKAQLYETTNLDNQRIWVVVIDGYKHVYHSKKVAKRVKQINDSK